MFYHETETVIVNTAHYGIITRPLWTSFHTFLRSPSSLQYGFIIRANNNNNNITNSYSRSVGSVSPPAVTASIFPCQCLAWSGAQPPTPWPSGAGGAPPPLPPTPTWTTTPTQGPPSQLSTTCTAATQSGSPACPASCPSR